MRHTSRIKRSLVTIGVTAFLVLLGLSGGTASASTPAPASSPTASVTNASAECPPYNITDVDREFQRTAQVRQFGDRRVWIKQVYNGDNMSVEITFNPIGLTDDCNTRGYYAGNLTPYGPNRQGGSGASAIVTPRGVDPNREMCFGDTPPATRLATQGNQRITLVEVDCDRRVPRQP
jgi:hypothetical protein